MPSSVIRRFRYVPEEARLEITFTTGRRYSYWNVPPELPDAMTRAFSKGEFFNAHIRDQFRFTRDALSEPSPQQALGKLLRFRPLHNQPKGNAMKNAPSNRENQAKQNTKARAEPDLEKFGRQAQDAQGKSIGKSDDQLRGDDLPRGDNQPKP